MELVATLIAPSGLSQGAVSAARDAIAAAGGLPGPAVEIDPARAIDIGMAGLARTAARAALEAVAHPVGIDVVVQAGAPGVPRVRRLLVADMDSTIIGQECIDELADLAGRGAEIAAITEAAMRGEIDFAEALRARVAALAGLEEEAIRRTLAERVRLNPGARTLVQTMKAHGCRTVLVSGGFTRFTGPVAELAGFDRQVANRLAIAEGRLAGSVLEPIVDAARKRETLLGECAALGIGPEQALAVGDGANDIPMLEAAGLGIAYRAKPRAAAAADAHIRHSDLTAILSAMGIARERFIEA